MSLPVYQWQPTTAEIAERAGIDPAAVIRFDHNTSPLMPPWTAAVAAAHAAGLNEYPGADYRPLREAIAAYQGVAPEWVVPGAGADEMILLCARALLEPGDTSASPAPTYPLYGIAAAQSRAGFVATGRDRRWEFDPEQLVGGDIDLVWLCLPNNPTGNRDPDDAVRFVLDNTGAPVVVDAAYSEFSGDRWAPWVRDYPNLIVLGTLSKAFGLAGIRVGYALGAPRTVAALDAVRPPGSISSVSAALAVRALAEPRWAQETVAVISEERARLAAGLERLGLEPLATVTNFVPVFVGAAAEQAEDELMGQGLVVRSYGKDHPLAGFLRFTVRSRRENDRLLDALERSLA